jgi:hypothetical protein
MVAVRNTDNFSPVLFRQFDCGFNIAGAPGVGDDQHDIAFFQ